MTKVPLRDENKGRAHAEAGPREPRDPRNQAGGEYKLGQGPAKVSSGLCSFLYETRILEFLRLAVWFFSRLILVASRARASLYTKPSGFQTQFSGSLWIQPPELLGAHGDLASSLSCDTSHGCLL